MQVKNEIVTFFFQFFQYSGEIVLYIKFSGDVRIRCNDIPVCEFGQVMDFNSGYLLMYAPYYRTGKYDISNGTEPDDQDLHRCKNPQSAA